MATQKVQGLTKEQKAQAKEKLHDMAIKESQVSPEDAQRVKDLFDIAKMPITLKDKDIKLGQGEIDFRELSDKNIKQMMFRYLTLNNIYLKDISTSLVDLMRLVMVLCDRLGIEDITKAIDEVTAKSLKQVQEKDKTHTKA